MAYEFKTPPTVDGVSISLVGHDHDDRYYTETELQTPGAAVVDWQNIANKPATGYLFFHDDASDISGYQSLLSTPAGGTEELDSVSITSADGEVEIESYATANPAGWGFTRIEAGVWDFSVWAYVSSTVAGDTTLRLRVYKRAAGGTETELFNVTRIITATSVTLHEILISQPEHLLDVTDRLVVKLFASTTRVPSTTVTFVHEGTLHDSHLHFPTLASANGDMLRAVYDADLDGTVDAAESVPWAGVTDKPSVFPPDTHSHTHDHDSAYSAIGHTHDYAASGHTHATYLPLAGGTMTGSTITGPSGTSFKLLSGVSQGVVVEGTSISGTTGSHMQLSTIPTGVYIDYGWYSGGLYSSKTVASFLDFLFTVTTAMNLGGVLTLDGASPGIVVGSTNLANNDAYVSLGRNRTGEGNCYVDFHSDGSSSIYTYESRLIRTPGDNGTFTIVQRGTGNLVLNAEQAAAILFKTTNADRMKLTAAGVLELSNDPSDGVAANRQRSPTSISLGDNITATISPAFFGLVEVLCSTEGSMAEYLVWSGGTTVLMDSPINTFTNTAGTDTKTNIYVSGGNLIIQNMRGAARNYYLFLRGTGTSFD